MACSSLIAVVPDTEYRVVQFSHFSVKEFLTSDRLAASKMYASRYQHIQLEEAHTIMAQACLSVLLRLDYDIDYKSIKSFPLAEYAGEHFGDHVEFEGVLSQMYNGVDDLLDAEKPHFAAWLWMWRDPIYHGLRKRGPPKPDAVPLYHLVEFGHLGLVDYLISKRPEDINATRGYGGLLHAASRRGHSEMVSFLDHFLDVDVRNSNDQTPLHMAICGASRLDPGDPVDSRFLEVVRVLIELNADVNSRDNEGKTPLNRLLCISHGDGGFELAKFLLDHGADADTVDNEGSTLLHAASSRGCVKVVQLLLERGGNIHVQNEMGRTPLHRAAVHSSDNELDHYFDAIPFLLIMVQTLTHGTTTTRLRCIWQHHMVVSKLRVHSSSMVQISMRKTRTVGHPYMKHWSISGIMILISISYRSSWSMVRTLTY
ncbi:ankyrin repeat-containing domain protein [Russula compacta]|nr:ankyrin repeat-containing domain protein [Russula compacta]